MLEKNHEIIKKQANSIKIWAIYLTIIVIIGGAVLTGKVAVLKTAGLAPLGVRLPHPPLTGKTAVLPTPPCHAEFISPSIIFPFPFKKTLITLYQ